MLDQIQMFMQTTLSVAHFSFNSLSRSLQSHNTVGGSTGNGREYRRCLQGQWGIYDYDAKTFNFRTLHHVIKKKLYLSSIFIQESDKHNTIDRLGELKTLFKINKHTLRITINLLGTWKISFLE